MPDDTWKVAPVATLIIPNLVNAVLPDVLSDSILTDVPAPTVNASVVLKHSLRSVLGVLLNAVANPLIPVNPDPSPWNAVAVTTPEETIPLRAVIIPIESTFVTSSYVIVPPIDKLPVTLNVYAVVTPEITKPLSTLTALFASFLLTYKLSFYQVHHHQMFHLVSILEHQVLNHLHLI